MSKLTAYLALVLLTITASLSTAGTISESGLTWYETIAEGQEQAKKTDKLILVFFSGGPSCTWSVRLKTDTFYATDVKKKIMENVILVMVNVAETPKTKDYDYFKEIGGTETPYGVILDKDLKIKETIGGWMSSELLLRKLEPVIKENMISIEIKEAEKKFEKKEKKKYKDYFEMFELYYKHNRVDKAAELSELLLKEDPKNKKKNNAFFEIAIAKKMLAEEKITEMNKHLTNAKELDEKNKKGYYELALCIEMQLYYEKKEWESVIEIYDEIKESKMRIKNTQETLWYPMMAYFLSQKWTECESLLILICDADINSEKGKLASDYLKKVRELKN